MGMENLRAASRWLMDTAWVALRAPFGRYPSGHDRAIQGFYAALRGSRPLPVTLDEIRSATRLYETVTAHISAEGSRPESLEPERQKHEESKNR